jgi:hypothetical protein
MDAKEPSMHAAHAADLIITPLNTLTEDAPSGAFFFWRGPWKRN